MLHLFAYYVLSINSVDRFKNLVSRWKHCSGVHVIFAEVLDQFHQYNWIYIFEQSEQFILYTILLFLSFGLLSFNLHSYFLKVLFDLLANFNEKGFTNLLTFSDAHLMYGVGIYLKWRSMCWFGCFWTLQCFLLETWRIVVFF